MNEVEFFHVETVETASPPRGAADAGWCRYVVTSRRSRIVGRFHGTLTQTRRNAEHLVEGLNSRLQTGKAPWTPRAQSKKFRAAKRAAQ